MEMEAKAQRFLRRVLAKDTLPSFSPLALKLVQAAADEDCSIVQLVEIVEKDPGLSAKLLAMVNSPFYHRGIEITSIRRAVVTLGLKDLRMLTLSVSLKSALPPSHGKLDFSLFWRTSLHRAVLARETAALVGIADPEEAFVTGLIHEIGLPLLLMALRSEELGGFPGFHHSLDEQQLWELDRFGLDHYRVGAEVLSAWGLPQSLIDCQLMVKDGHGESVSSLAKLADFARRAAESFFAPGVELTQVHNIAKSRFGLGEDKVNQLLVDSLSKVADVADALEINLDVEADMDEILSKAEEALISLKRQMVPQAKALLKQRKAGGEIRDNGLSGIKAPLLDLGGFVGRLSRNLEQGHDQSTRIKGMLKEMDKLSTVLDEFGVSHTKKKFK
jgi:HD-like signal output (HDOD) protein